MADRITVRGLRLDGRVGVPDEERATPQLLELDIELEVDLDAAARSDELADTVDYGPLIELCRRTLDRGEFKLLEGLAGALVDRVLEEAPRASAATIRVRKLAVPVDADVDFAEVELRRTRLAPG
jgi:dihydroneopterin aldolase